MTIFYSNTCIKLDFSINWHLDDTMKHFQIFIYSYQDIITTVHFIQSSQFSDYSANTANKAECAAYFG